MAKWVKYTSTKQQEPIYVNIDVATTMEKYSETTTLIRFVSDTYIEVEGVLADVVNRADITV